MLYNFSVGQCWLLVRTDLCHGESAWISCVFQFRHIWDFPLLFNVNRGAYQVYDSQKWDGGHALGIYLNNRSEAKCTKGMWWRWEKYMSAVESQGCCSWSYRMRVPLSGGCHDFHGLLTNYNSKITGWDVANLCATLFTASICMVLHSPLCPTCSARCLVA